MVTNQWSVSTPNDGDAQSSLGACDLNVRNFALCDAWPDDSCSLCKREDE